MRLAPRALLGLIGAGLGFHPIIEGDTYWHLMLGRAVLREGRRSVTEPTALATWSEPCTVPEWLWDIFTYGIHAAFGDAGLSLVSVLFGALLGVGLGWLLDALLAAQQRQLTLPLGLITLAGVTDHLNVRPNAAFLVLLSVFLGLVLRYRARASGSLGLSVGIVVTAVVWAQVHGSFVLAPAIFVILMLPSRLRARVVPRSDLAVFAGVLAAALTCAHGLGVVDFVLTHSGGDATTHIADMAPFDWSMLAPLAWPNGAVLCTFLALGSLSWLLKGTADVSFLLLGALGAAMTHTAMRFSVEWVVLLLPWAAAGAAALYDHHQTRPRVLAMLRLGSWLTAGVLVSWAAQRVDEHHGPLLRTGVRADVTAKAAARYLSSRLPRGTAVFTEYQAGGPLGFQLDGRLRTFVDGRTPLYFDAADYAIARDMSVAERSLDEGFRHYGIGAAVVDRGSPACAYLARRWKAVVAEPRYTTFVPSDVHGDALSGIAPCGRHYLEPDACAGEARAALASAKAMHALEPSAFSAFLAAAVTAQCRQGAAQQPDAFPADADARPYLSQQRLYRALSLMKAGRGEPALEIIEDTLDDEDPLPVRVLLDYDPVSGRLSNGHVRRVLERGVIMMADNAPPALRARLALLCAGLGDAECAREHGARAVLAGAREALPAVGFAAEHHPSPRVRADMARLRAAHGG